MILHKDRRIFFFVSKVLSDDSQVFLITVQQYVTPASKENDL